MKKQEKQKQDNNWKKDQFSKLNDKELRKVIKMLTIELDSGRGLPIPHYSGWSSKIMRQFIRYLYRNLKEDYINKIKILKALEKGLKEPSSDR